MAGLVWVEVPGFAAAGLALDHPAWSDPDVDSPAGAPAVDETSWWPPGRRYEWTGQRTGNTFEAIDPWNSTFIGHLWTAGVVAGTGLFVYWLWRGSTLAPRTRLPIESRGWGPRRA